MPPLDPIVSLSVSVAEKPGSHAFLLGSGISREAGVPTGEQVFWQAIGELYRLENTTSETPDHAALTTWMEENDRADLGYSEILEQLVPDRATRRDYLAKHFEGKEPGPSHEELAALAAEGAVKVFVTTNFDRLLEHALQARGIEPVLITSAADLASAPRREHADCYVIKPHGDYLQETIRNTPEELAELEPKLAAELAEIFDRFGVVVLGYSGSDPAISELLQRRISRYGLYWVARSELRPGAARILESTGGRVISRGGAAAFMVDLRRRLEVFRSYPSGHTPMVVHDEVLALIRAEDEIGLAEVMRRERREYAGQLSATVAEYRRKPFGNETALAAHDQVLPIWERRLAGLLPLIAHEAGDLRREVRAMVEVLEDKPSNEGSGWVDLIDWASWWLGTAVGSFALFVEAWAPLRLLVEANVSEIGGRQRDLIDPGRWDNGGEISKIAMNRVSETDRLTPRWDHLNWSLGRSPVLKERWPEFLRADGKRLPAVANFDFLISMRDVLEHDGASAYWKTYYNGGLQIARRLRTDGDFLAEVVDLLGAAAIGDFLETVGAALKEKAHPIIPSYPESVAVEELSTERG
jgi:hypothetical protein